MAAQPFAQLDVFHQGDRRIAAQLVEQAALDKDGLVTGAHGSQPRAPVHHPRDHRQQWRGGAEPDVKTAPAMRAAWFWQQIDKAVGQAGIGVQKQQPIAFCRPVAYNVDWRSS